MTITATDGKAMGTITSTADNKETGSLIIPTETVASIKLGRKDNDEGILTVGNEEYSIAANGITHPFVPVDAKYPNYKGIIPSEINSEAVNYDSTF